MKEICTRVFPKSADQNYQGHYLALLLLLLYTAKSLFSGAIHMFAPDGGAQSIASVALDQFGDGGAESVITMFGLWGMEQVIIGLISVVILLRYRSLIPMMCMFYVLEYAGRYTAKFYTPGLVTAHAPPGLVGDYVLVPLTVLMFLLAVYRPKKKRV